VLVTIPSDEGPGPCSNRAETLCKTLFDGAGLKLASRQEAGFLREFCQLLVDSGLFISAAIGRMDRQKIWRYHGAAQIRDVSHFRTAVTRYRPGEANPSLTLLAWAERQSLFVNHYATDPRFARYHAHATSLGIGAIGAIVIRRHQQLWAVLTVAAAEENVFDAELISLLERVAGMLGRHLDESDLTSSLTRARQAPHGTGDPLTQEALRLHYQPVLELHSGRIVSVEALARLEAHGRLSLPQDFLPGLLMDGRLVLFRQVLRQALAQLAAWDREGLRLNLSVNIEAPVLLLNDTLADIRAALSAAGIAPYRLVLELRETHEFLDYSRARDKIAAVRRAGIRLAVNDSGAGHAALLGLRELPLDIVKLDRAFVLGLRRQPNDLRFISALQNLTATREIALVVEGVESDDVLDAMRMLGVRQVQGFSVAPPMEAGAFAAWLRAQPQARGAAQPQTLLGAYAVHLAWLRAFNASFSRGGLAGAMNNTAFCLTDFFAARESPGGLLSDAYRQLCGRMSQPNAARGLILQAAVEFRAQLMAALRAEG